MANTENLQSAKELKYDEFYTQYNEIQKEINAYLEYNPDTFKDVVQQILQIARCCVSHTIVLKEIDEIKIINYERGSSL